jgi:syringomycin synthetase protein SyrE
MTLGAQLSADLQAFARQHELTPFMVLYAGWVVLLSRLSGQDDVVIGTPIANRQRPELDDLIGVFVNTLALRIAVPADLQIRPFLARVKEVALGAYSHQDVPFEKIVEALQPERNLSRNPVFQVMLTLQSIPAGEWQFPGLEATFEDGAEPASLFDLLISLEERDGTIAGSLTYSTDLYDRETVERWTCQFSPTMSDGRCWSCSTPPRLRIHRRSWSMSCLRNR